MYKPHPTHGAGTWPHRTQLKTAARKTTLNAGQCVRQPREGRGRNRQAPPPKKKREGGGGKGTKTAHSRQTAHQHHHRRPSPPPEGNEKKENKRDPHRGTGGPPTQNRQHQASISGPRGKGTQKKKKKKKKKEPPAQPERKGMEGQGPQSPKKKEKKKPKRKKRKKNTPRQPSQEGLGTGETRAQHTRPHRAPEPETAGGKRGAHETTHVPKAGRNRSPTANTTNSRH